MGEKFDQIFDFQYRQAIKLENSSYLEDLTGLLAKVASHIDDDTNYFFGDEFYLSKHEEEPNSNFTHFVEDFKNSIYNGSSEKINIIRGRAGIGKTLFFTKGVQQLIRSENAYDDIYIHMGVDFKNIDNDNGVEYYEEWIYKKLYQNAIDCIHILGAEVYKSFDEEFCQFGNTYETPHTRLFPLKFFCEKIYNKYRKPCIIIFDNIDLASVKTQKNVFDAVVNVCSNFNMFMRVNYSSDYYRIYFAMRPETELRYNEGRIGVAINFPLPNILKISLAIMNKVLFETAEEFDKKRNLSCNVIFHDVISADGKMIICETFTDVAKYFYKILNYYLSDIWNNNSQSVERLGTCEEFHCNIVNYNVRTFVRFLSDTISNGGFKPLTKEFIQKQGGKHYNIYDYIEMIIRGRWPVHPGNKHITGEGGNNAPIVYNIFETSLYGSGQKNKVKHFMLNIRILQCFFLCGKNYEIRYGDMKQVLGVFFDEKHIYDATRRLIYVRFMYSYIQGDNIIATIQNWQDIKIDDSTILNLSPVGKFYLEQLIYEFEYLYQMALSSLMCEKYVNELRTIWKNEKERTVLYFLKSIYEIIKENLKSYSSAELVAFKKAFYYIDDQRGSKPFRRMLDRFISVMKNKVQRAERLDTSSITKLEDILQEALALKDEVINYINFVMEK